MSTKEADFEATIVPWCRAAGTPRATRQRATPNWACIDGSALPLSAIPPPAKRGRRHTETLGEVLHGEEAIAAATNTLITL